LGSGFEGGRRSFLNWLLGTTGGALLVSVFYPVLRYVSPPDVPEAATNQVEAGRTNDPELLDKGYKIVRFGAEPVIVIRVSDTDFRAFSATCTHLDCIVEYRKQKELIWCNCHNGQYDLNGKNVGGPPPKPLTPFVAHVVTKTASEPGTIVVERG
jgi:Rieske Fe-S protein